MIAWKKKGTVHEVTHQGRDYRMKYSLDGWTVFDVSGPEDFNTGIRGATDLECARAAENVFAYIEHLNVSD